MINEGPLPLLYQNTSEIIKFLPGDFKFDIQI